MDNDCQSNPQKPAKPPTFTTRKTSILASLAQPTATYTDLSPKGSVDTAIRDLIDRLNALEGVVTTSSCAGRVSVFLEGVKEKDGKGKGKGRNDDDGSRDGDVKVWDGGDGISEEEEEEEDSRLGEGEGEEIPTARQAAAATTSTVPGGKGRGGRWLFVSHEPVEMVPMTGTGAVSKFLGLEDRGERGVSSVDELDVHRTRFVRFQFEPMILHVQTASLHAAAPLLGAAIGAGFRESGVQSLKNLHDTDAFPMVAIRSSGLALESLIGYLHEEEGVIQSVVSEEYLRLLLKMANERFLANTERMRRFENAMFNFEKPGPAWEDAETRRTRKKAEGLQRRGALRKDQAG